MKSVVQKDKKKRGLVYKSEKDLFILKNLSKNTSIKPSLRHNISLKLFNISDNEFNTRVVNRCIVTYRKSKIHNYFRFSRLFFLKLARQGAISGLKKSSW